MSKLSLKFFSLGGIDEVTNNMYVYELGGDILVVDCGIGFPEETVWGVDLVIPDISYLEQRKEQVRGILITHGHEDHFGALPYLLPKLGYPHIWSTRLVAGFIEGKLREFKLEKKSRLRVIDPDGTDNLSLGAFTITPFRVNHSVPDSVGYVLETSLGRLVHVADFKFDWQAVSGQKFDIQKLVTLVKDGSLFLTSDCLGVNHPGYTQSEEEIEISLEQIIRASKGKIFFTTLSSNISRIQQVINAARKYQRSLVTLGRSIDTNVKIAQRLGYLDLRRAETLSVREARHKPDHRLLYLIAGSYGQENSALSRLARREHPLAKVNPGDTVIFSADPSPPGTRGQVDIVVDNLMRQGTEVHYYDIQENLYVSGHGSRGDLALLINLTKPRFLIPIGGTPRHLYAYESLARELKMGEKVFILATGDVLTITPQGASVSGKIPVKRVYVDGKRVGDLNEEVLKERQRLGKEGLLLVSLMKRPAIRTLGFVLPSGLADEIRKLVVREIETRDRTLSFKNLTIQIEKEIGDLINRKLDYQPVVLVLSERVNL